MARTPTTKRQAVDRLHAFMAANAEERANVQRALADGGVAILPTAFGPYRLDAIVGEWEYSCHPEGKPKDWANTRTFYGANDYTWASICAQLGVKRHPLNAARTVTL